MRNRLFMLGVAMLVPGCTMDSAEEWCPRGFFEKGKSCELDERAVGEAVASLKERAFVRINYEPFEQQFGPPTMRNIWVSHLGLDEDDTAWIAGIYSSIDPNDSTARLPGTMSAGTILVHEAPLEARLGVMVKGVPGSSKALNDWWFGRFWADGTPAPIEDSYDASCRDCHVMDGRPERTDMLWGVPRAVLP